MDRKLLKKSKTSITFNSHILKEIFFVTRR